MAEVIYDFVVTTRGSLAFGFTRTLETIVVSSISFLYK